MNAKRPRVLVLLKTLGVGGAETLVLASAAHWDRERFDYRLAYVGGSDALGADFAAQEVTATRLSPLGFSNDPLALPALGRHLRSEPVELIHAHLPAPTLLAALAREGSRTRLIATNHSEEAAMRAPTRLLARRAWPKTDAVIAVGEEIAREMEPGIQTRVIENGVDLQRFAETPAQIPGVPQVAPVVLFLGNLIERKRPVETLKVFEKALEQARQSRAHLVYAGQGPLRWTLERARRASPVKDRVHLLGQRRDVPALARRADVLVLLSRAEGLPMALLEGAAGGAALLATAVAAASSLVVEGQTGFLVKTDEEAARRLSELLGDQGLARLLGEAAHRRVAERFSLNTNVRRTEALYEELLGP